MGHAFSRTCRWISLPLPILGLLLLAACGPVLEPPSPARTEQRALVFLSPQEGQVLSDHEQLVIEARFEPVLDLEPLQGSQVSVRATGLDGGESMLIAQGDLRSFETPDRFRAFWDVTEVPAGRYEIMMQATADGVRGTSRVEITVHHPPAVDLRLTSLTPQGAGAQAEFEVAADPQSGAELVSYTWTPGDGSPAETTTEPRFRHLYGERGATYVVWVETLDALGGSSLVARDLVLPEEIPRSWTTIPEEVFQETHDCGCRRMTIRAAAGADTNIYCAAAVPASPGCAAVPRPPPGTCPRGQTAFRCPLGEITPALPAQRLLGWRFEIVADLMPATNDQSRCTQGQYARGTRVVDGNLRANPGAPAAPPAGARMLPGGGLGGFRFTAVAAGAALPQFGGPNYGADDYTIPFAFKRHRPLQFYWADAPRGAVGRISRTSDNEFISFVQGNLGTCWCRYWLRQSWTRAGTQGPGVVQVDGQNCFGP